MTALEKLEANEKKIAMLDAVGWRCEVGGEPLTISTAQLAHRIPSTKSYINKYGAYIIHHRLNMAVTCAKHNSYVLIDPKTHPVEAEALITRIRIALDTGVIW